MNARPLAAAFRGLVAILVAWLAIARAPAARAQDYAVEVPSVLLQAWVEPDGTLTLDYTFSIRNAPGARVLDGIDVGLPTTRWSLSRVSAWEGGQPTRAIERSPYIDNGVAVGLAGGGLSPGEASEVRVRIEGVGGLLFSDTSLDDHVSLRLTPTWFDGRFVRGASMVRLVVHLPPGVAAADLKWHAVPWVGQVTVEADAERPEHAAVVFEKQYAFTRPWQVGVSFPRYVTGPGGARREVVAGVKDISTWDLFATWAAQPPQRALAKLAFVGAFTVLFFWATRRTGCVLWGGLAVVLLGLFTAFPFLPWLASPLLPLVAWLVASARRRAKRRYVPAVASVEGGGIKRGLTAPEAACLLEAPPEKILLLALYGLSRKGFAVLEAKGKDGMVARAAEGFGLGRASDLKAAAEKGQVLHPYESAFLAPLKGAVLTDVAKVAWQRPLEELARHAATRLQGYDVNQTREYYRSIVARAWAEAASIGNVQLRQEAVDRVFDWLVLDDRAWDRMRGWDRAGWGYDNPWLPGRARAGRVAGAGLPAPATGSVPPPLPGAPTASDVAGSLGGRLESLSGSFASALGVGAKPQGVFAGFDKVASDVFSEMAKAAASSGRGGGGGGGFSCACACAGCACACACAGGGR